VGAPGEDIGAMVDAGAVNVIYGSAAGLDAAAVLLNQFLYEGNNGVPHYPDDGDRFGSALAWGDFNNDGYDDLAIGSPGEKLPSGQNTGAVAVIFGSSNGLDPASAAYPAQWWNQGSVGLNTLETPEAYDDFGATLAVGDFNNDGYDDLAIGSPGEDPTGTTPNAGAVLILYGWNNGCNAYAPLAAQLWHQDIGTVVNTAESFDNFGAALTTGDFDGDGNDDLAIGVPNEDVKAVVRAGAVNVLYGSGSGLSDVDNQLWHQNTAGMPDTAEASDHFGTALAAGDFDGDSHDDLAIGVPNESLTVAGVFLQYAGAVNVIYGSNTGLTAVDSQLWTQNRNGIADSAENIDFFGSSLAAGNFNGDVSASGYPFDDLAIGVPKETTNAGIVGAGAVHVLYGSSLGLQGTGSQFWHQNKIRGVAEDFDSFGTTLVAADFDGNGYDDLGVGVPGEDSTAGLVNVGAVNVIYGSNLKLTTLNNQFWQQNKTVDTAESNDEFGGGSYGP
jgi:hypothetical protein